jgi:cytoskeleton protein RodZ
MDEETNQEENQAEFTQGSGSILAAARKQQQKTIEDIAGELNLSVTQVKTIELDQTDGLPEPTYVRGYIRGYAKLLGLNPEEVLKSYLNSNWQQSTSLNDIPRGIGNAEESDTRFLTPMKLIGFLALLGGLVFFWYTGLFDELIKPQSTVSQTSPQATVDDSDVAIIDSIDLADIVDEPEGDAVATDVDLGANSSTEEADVINELTFSFSETSWVDIRDDKDERLAYKSYVAGEDLTVESTSNLSVFVGNAAGVSVKLNGQDFDLAPHREGVYAKFIIDK